MTLYGARKQLKKQCIYTHTPTPNTSTRTPPLIEPQSGPPELIGRCVIEQEDGVRPAAPRARALVVALVVVAAVFFWCVRSASVGPCMYRDEAYGDWGIPHTRVYFSSLVLCHDPERPLREYFRLRLGEELSYIVYVHTKAYKI